MNKLLKNKYNTLNKKKLRKMNNTVSFQIKKINAHKSN